jgi:hypothetical protein
MAGPPKLWLSHHFCLPAACLGLVHVAYALADSHRTVCQPRAGAREYGVAWNVGVRVHGTRTWSTSSATCAGKAAAGRQHTKAAVARKSPPERLPWGADSGCTVGLVILLQLLGAGFGGRHLPAHLLLYHYSQLICNPESAWQGSGPNRNIGCSALGQYCLIRGC